MPEQRLVEADQRGRPPHNELVQRAQHAEPRAVAIAVPDDQLGDQRVVEVRDHRPGDDPGVDADARPGRLAIFLDGAGVGRTARRVLRVDPALDRVAGEAHVRLCDTERLTRCDADLLPDEVDAGDHLGHGVLDLDARVHLEEPVVAVAIEETLDRPCRSVAHRPGRVHGHRADALPELGVNGRGRRLLDELLVAALDRAVALSEVQYGAMGVRQHLHLDMTWVLDVLLHVDGRVGEVGLALPSRRLEGALDLLGRMNDLQAFAAAPCGGLEREQRAELRAEPSTSAAEWTGSVVPGTIGTPAERISSRAAVFEPIASIASGGGPIQTSPACSTARAKAAFSARKP